MKETKTYQVKCRLTPTDKNKITEYCEKHNMNMSEFIRIACERMYNQEDK